MYDCHLDPAFYSSSSDHYDQNIKDFLRKPVIIDSGVLSSTDVFGTTPDIFIPTTVLDLKPLYQDKLKGYLGFRATTVFQLVVNANPMQQGRYMMCVAHLGGDFGSKEDAASEANANTLVQRTQLPHVEIDISCDTEAVLRIPYVSALNFFPLSSMTTGSAIGTVARLWLAPYVALSTGTGSSTCGYTLWAHFEDVELIGPALPQSGRMFGGSVRKRGAKSTAEQEGGSKSRPFSSTLVKISGASSLFKDVPLLGAYAQGVSWASDILAKAAYIFGWSKPNDVSPVGRHTRAVAPYMTNVDGVDLSFPLSLMSKAAVGMAKGFSGTEVDELDFMSLARIPAWRSTTSWTTAQTAGTSLISTFVSPVGNIQQRTQNAVVYYDYIPSAFICQYFRYWRGSMVFTFKLVKTDYHSGRIVVAYAPVSGIDTTLPAVTLANTEYLHREIIDVRDCNEFTFVVPYLSCAPYSLTDNSQNSSNIGNILVFVLDPLVAPDTVSSTVSIILEVSMGADFEVAYPRTRSLVPGYEVTPQSGDMFGGSNSCSIAETAIGASSVSSANTINAENCIGEKITSFRQLLKVAMPLFARLSAIVPSANGIFIVPFAFGVCKNQVGPVFAEHSCDLYSTLSSCYVFSRGGVRIKVRTQTISGAGYTNIAYLRNVPTSSTIVSSVASATSDQAFTPFMLDRGDNGVMEVQIPQYHRYVSRINAHCVANASYTYGISNVGHTPDIGLQIQHGEFTPTNIKSYTVFRSMADDGNMGLFKSIPPMMRNLSYSTAS